MAGRLKIAPLSVEGTEEANNEKVELVSSDSNSISNTPIMFSPCNSQNLKVNPQNLKFIKKLGEGMFSFVDLYVDKTTNTQYAIKCIRDLEEGMTQQINTELSLLQSCDSPFVVKYYGYYRENEFIYVVLEYMDAGSLKSVIEQTGPIPEDILAIIAVQVIRGLVELHGKHIIHRDLKPSNLLISRAGIAQLADFGAGRILTSTLDNAMTFSGTVTYMAPERISADSYSYPSDIWSLGLSLYECATGKYPYDSAETGEVREFFALWSSIVKSESPKLPSKFSIEFRNFVQQCLRKEPEDRPKAHVLLDHPYVAKINRNLPEHQKKLADWINANLRV